MKILLIADGRSPITRQWIKTVCGMKHTTHLVSTFPCDSIPEIEQLTIIPVAFSNMAGTQVTSSNQSKKTSRGMVRKLRKPLMFLRYWLGPHTLHKAGKQLQDVINVWQPDLVHALRIPFEGMLAANIARDTPLVISIWGNDLTLHTKGSRIMRHLTRKTLKRADGLLTDACRDIRLAKEWGFNPMKPSQVVPGSGGIDLIEIENSLYQEQPLPWIQSGQFHAINPRGLRPGYINTREFFAAASLVLEQLPGVTFLCPGMQGQEEALGFVKKYHLEEAVKLLPYLAQSELWQLFKSCEVTLSLSTHDGTPNTLLEAMTCGCFPIAGDLESLRDWITPGVNGFLVDVAKPAEIARAVIHSFQNANLRKKAKDINFQIISERASRATTRQKLSAFYDEALAGKRSEIFHDASLIGYNRGGG